MMNLGCLALLAIPVACASWTIAKEFIFQEFRDWCKAQGVHYGNTIKNRWLRWFVVKVFYFLHFVLCHGVLYALDWNGGVYGPRLEGYGLGLVYYGIH